MTQILEQWILATEITDWLMVFLTIGIVYFAWQTSRISRRMEQLYERLNWLTGAMESHSETMLLIEAKRGVNGEPIPTIWWDPTIESVGKRKHREIRELNEVKFNVPEKDRAGTEKT